jgi:RNA polymerase sigma factor (sigma-70 family)
MDERSTSLLDNLEHLIKACKAGERSAQNRLYTLFSPKLFIVCQRYTADRAEAEDVLQEGFIRIFTYLGQFKHEGSFEGWMRRIMVNCALQRYQQRSTWATVVHMEDEQMPGAENNVAPSQLGQKELMKLVQQLPPAYRMVFNLYVFEGYKHREIAEILRISEGTSKSNLSDARTILQKQIMKMNSVDIQKVNSL